MNHYLFCKYLLSIILVYPLLTVQPGKSVASTFIVNSIQDANDLEPGNNLCVAYINVFPPYVLPFCTLRGAIEETNALPGPDIIILPAGTFSLSKQGSHENGSLTGDLDITSSLLILGAGVERTFIDAAGIDRVFDIFGPDSNVVIKDVAITNGHLDSQPAPLEEGGAGIRTSATLSLENVLLSGNITGHTIILNTGGGILNYGACSINNSTIKNNIAWFGGGISNGESGILEINNTTINENSAQSGAGISNYGSASLVNVTISTNNADLDKSSQGGAIFNNGKLQITQSTITKNVASGNGGGIFNEGTLDIINTIISENKNNNCSQTKPIFSHGYNLEDTNTCSLYQATDLINIKPKLTSLGNHGGPTKTHALFISSPAVNSGKNLLAAGISTDQRGVSRPLGKAFDIGAYETKKRSIVPLFVQFLLKNNI